MKALLALLTLLPPAQVPDVESGEGRFVARTLRAPGFEHARVEQAVWQVDVYEQLGREGERFLWTQRVTNEQLGDVRLLAPDGSALVTIRSEIYGSRPLVRIYRRGSDPDGLDENDLGLDRRDYEKKGAGRPWLAEAWVGWRDAGEPQLVAELETVHGRLLVLDLVTGEFAAETALGDVTITPGVPAGADLPHKARVTGFFATPVVREGEALQVDVSARRTAPYECFVGFDAEFRGAHELVLIPRLERRPSRPGVYPVTQQDVHFDVKAWITGLEPGSWQVSVEGANGELEPARVDVLAPGLLTTLSLRDAEGRVYETVSLFEDSVARHTTSRGEVAFLHVTDQELKDARRLLGRLPSAGYERTSRRGERGVTYEIAWWPYGDRRTVVVDDSSARGRVEELLELLLALRSTKSE